MGHVIENHFSRRHERDHVALRPQKRGCLLRTGKGGGGRERESEGSTADTAPKKTGETVDRRQNNGMLRRCPLAIAQRLVHCAIAVSTAVMGRVTRTMSVTLLLWNNPKRKKSNFRSPAPPHDLFWANLRVQLHLPPLDLAWNPVCVNERAPVLILHVLFGSHLAVFSSLSFTLWLVGQTRWFLLGLFARNTSISSD